MVLSQIEQIRACKIVPVITLDDVEHAVPLANALLSAGVDVLEITLRTPSSLECINAISKAGLDVLIGAGTIMQANDIIAAKEAGAQFLVSPGMSPALLQPLKQFDGLVLPGVSTVSEALTLREAGFRYQKFFPAEAAGGARFKTAARTQ